MLGFVFLLLLSLAYICLTRSQRHTPIMLAVSSNDSDMKIVPSTGIEAPVVDDGEEAAREFLAQKKNGNIEKAYVLGEKLAFLFLSEGTPILLLEKAEQCADMDINQRLFFAFLAETLLTRQVGSLLAQTAIREFSSRVERQDPQLYQKMNDQSSFSVYLLNSKKNPVDFKDEGKAFAYLCGKEGDAHFAAVGEQLCAEYQSQLSQMISQLQFS